MLNQNKEFAVKTLGQILKMKRSSLVCFSDEASLHVPENFEIKNFQTSPKFSSVV